jgi:hypothetical protein
MRMLSSQENHCLSRHYFFVMVVPAVLSLFSFTCTDRAVFDESDHAWSYPRAFACDIDVGAVSINDSAGLAKTISIPVGSPAYLIGLITNPRTGMQLEGQWSFDDGAAVLDTFVASCIKKHVFTDQGVYTAIFSISDGFGNSLHDSVNIWVTGPGSL